MANDSNNTIVCAYKALSCMKMCAKWISDHNRLPLTCNPGQFQWFFLNGQWYACRCPDVGPAGPHFYLCHRYRHYVIVPKNYVHIHLVSFNGNVNNACISDPSNESLGMECPIYKVLPRQDACTGVTHEVASKFHKKCLASWFMQSSEHQAWNS